MSQRRPARNRTSKSKGRKRRWAPEPQWSLDDLIVGGLEDGIAWVPVVQAPTAKAAEQVLGAVLPSGAWRTVGKEFMAPTMDEDWEREPWWIVAEPDAPYAAEMWRLVDVECEVFYDIHLEEEIANPYYRKFEGG